MHDVIPAARPLIGYEERLAVNNVLLSELEAKGLSYIGVGR